MKESVPLLKVRGQPVSDGSFVCVLTFFGFGASGRDCCALALLKNSESSKIRAHMTDDAAASRGYAFAWSDLRRTSHCAFSLTPRTRQAKNFQTYPLRSYCFLPLPN